VEYPRPGACIHKSGRRGLEHRVIYIAKFHEGVYVLHAFEKKTRRTARADIDLARARFKDALKNRQSLQRGAPRRSR
jgi:phage-related protein